MIYFIVVLFLSYLAGSIPTAIIAGRMILKDDIRKYGSKNAGATNVLRVMGWKPALVVVLIDVGKGAVATLLFARLGAPHISMDPMTLRILAGLMAIVGHVLTVFAGFKGGKGVGTAFGVLLGLAPLVSLVTLGVWLILVFSTRIVSIGSLSAGVTFPMLLLLKNRFMEPGVPTPLLVFGAALGVLIVWTHRGNIRRLMNGTENRFGSKSKPTENSGDDGMSSSHP